MTEWQDISTAPRDGTEVLAFENGARYVAAWRLWFKTPEHDFYAWFAARGGDEQFYGSDGYEPIINCDLEPSHWQPLPKPPSF